MPVPANQTQTTPMSVAMFRLFLITTITMIAGMGGIIYCSRAIRTVSGKAVDMVSETEFSSRKNSYQQDVAVIQYSVDGKQHTGKAAVPRKKHTERGSIVPAYYYPALPQFAWFYNKENGLIVYAGLLLAVSLIGLAASASVMRKRNTASTGLSPKISPKTSKQSRQNPDPKKNQK